ncbi:hypothetical protein BGX28_003849 [Mortierella sp. GBA30]|nr:hypothetical protein BGX28_003849 [Mortierella sp. GBA30]
MTGNIAKVTAAPHLANAKILIVGAGIGGLVLGALLEKAGIDYEIFERAKVVVPLGSGIYLGPNVMHFFEQLGIADEIKASSKPVTEVHQYYGDKKKPIGYYNIGFMKDRHGYHMQVIPRPILYDLILKLVPKEKIRFGTKVTSIQQDSDCVMIQTIDNTTYRGDILVGADGAYSAVRQSLYKQLDEKGVLPASDRKRLPYSNICILGTTKPLSLERFKFVDKEDSYAAVFVSKTSPYTIVLTSAFNNCLCWFVIERLESVANKDDTSEGSGTSEWGAEATVAMCKQVRDLPLPYDDITIGDLIDETPEGLISMVTLEEKIFDTWHGGRTVLLGDACHKMHPAGASGGATAIHDAIVLANRLHALPSTKVEDLEEMFKEYKAERNGSVPYSV